jgi:hypothetical protein
MSGTLGPVALTGIVNELQKSTLILNQILRALQAGVAIQSSLPSYTVASLPATAATGAMAFATTARKPGEGAGLGTGMPVFFNPATSTWFTTLGVLVTV